MRASAFEWVLRLAESARTPEEQPVRAVELVAVNVVSGLARLRNEAGFEPRICKSCGHISPSFRAIS